MHDLQNGHNPKKRLREEAFPPSGIAGASLKGGSLHQVMPLSMASFHCSCPSQHDPSAQTVVPSTGLALREHRHACDKMGERYGKLYDQWEGAVERSVATDSADEWRNMRALYEHFRARFIEQLELQRAEQLKRRKLNDEAAGRGVNGSEKDVVMINGGAEGKEEEKGEDVFEGFKCVGCEKLFKDFEKMGEELVFLESCSHVVCKECISEQITLSYPEVKCLSDGCEEKLQDFEVRIILGQEAYEALQQKMTNKALEGEQNMVKCKCGNMIELVGDGKVYYDIKND
jgi:hypothetical protein